MYNEFEEKEYKSKFNIKIWNRIFKEMFKYPFYCIGSVLAMIGAAFTETMFIKYICSDGLEKFLDTGIDSSFFAFVIGMIMFVLCLGACTTMFLYFAGTLELKFYRSLTKKTFSHLQNQPFSFFDRSSVGWLMARVSSDTSRLGEIISWGLVDIVYAIFKKHKSLYVIERHRSRKYRKLSRTSIRIRIISKFSSKNIIRNQEILCLFDSGKNH